MLQSSRTGSAYLHEDPPGSKYLQLHMQPVELLSAVHLVPPAGLLCSIALHGQQADAQQVGPPLCHDGCTSLPQLLFIAEHQIVKRLVDRTKDLVMYNVDKSGHPECALLVASSEIVCA